MISMIESKDGKTIRIVSDPRLFDKQDKEQAYSQGFEYICRCKPDKDLRYKFSKDLRLYPVRKNDIAAEHSPYCIFSDQYDKKKTSKAVIPVDKDTGEIRAEVVENIAVPLSGSYKSDSSETKPEDDDEESTPKAADSRMRVARLIKAVNLEISQKQASAFNKKVRDMYNYNRWVYMQAKEVSLEGRNMMLNCSEPGVRFIYECFKDMSATVKDKSGASKEYILSEMDYDILAFSKATQKNGYRCKLVTTYVDKAGEKHDRIWYMTTVVFRSVLRNYIKEHNDDSESIPLKFNGHIIAAGYEYDMDYKDKAGMTKQTKKIGRLWLITVSERGIYSRTPEEATMHEAALSLMQEMKDVRYYAMSIDAPCGILSVDGYNKTAIISLDSERRGAKTGNDIFVVFDSSTDNAKSFTGKLKDALSAIKDKEHS